jgi:hypothetical protein
MIDWPSREQWAEQRRTPYYDQLDDLSVRGKLITPPLPRSRRSLPSSAPSMPKRDVS